MKHKKHNLIVTRLKCLCQIRCNERYLPRRANYSLTLLCSHILLEVLCKWASQKPFSGDSSLVWSCVVTIKIFLSDLLLQGATLVPRLPMDTFRSRATHWPGQRSFRTACSPALFLPSTPPAPLSFHRSHNLKAFPLSLAPLITNILHN